PDIVAITRPYTPRRASSLPMSWRSAAEIQRGSSAYSVPASRASTSRATAMACRWSWFGWRRNCTNPAGVSTDSTHATSSARGAPGHSARTNRPDRWRSFTSERSSEDEAEQLVDERVEELVDGAGREHE